MLNITQNTVREHANIDDFKAVQRVSNKRYFANLNTFLKVFVVISLVVLFLPWTQNVTGSGFITTLRPNQRPQTIHSAIPGRIEKWYVKEGDFVKSGDTILFISEVKDDYFDPNLLDRTKQQVQAKGFSVTAYTQKVEALSGQIDALEQEGRLKLEQSRNKLLQAHLSVESDSIDFEAAKTQLQIAERQYKRTVTLNEEGLKALTDVEEKKLKLQESQAKIIAKENKLLASKNEVINAQVEINRVKAEYKDKIAKAKSDKFTALSSQYNAEADKTKLENQLTNYTQRRSLHYILAPQSGFVNKALQSGIGETFKEGASMVSIMPAQYELAVETFVNPIDLPLIHVGENVRIQFDGWPAIVFSGWPDVTYGTYGGRIVAVETFISENGKYRILIAPDVEDHEWPKDLRVGSGARTMALLQDVPIWYELWRQLNGFPPDYYSPKTPKTDQKEKSS